jgi:hypothetical protein
MVLRQANPPAKLKIYGYEFLEGSPSTIEGLLILSAY